MIQGDTGDLTSAVFVYLFIINVEHKLHKTNIRNNKSTRKSYKC